MEIKVSSTTVAPCFFSFYSLCFVGLHQLLVLAYYRLMEISACLTSVLVLLLSVTQTGGEEESTGQTDPNPRSGQAPKNEEEEGLPGEVRGHAIYPGSKFTDSFLLFVKLVCLSFHPFH